MYNGCHGINWTGVVEADSIGEANEIGQEVAFDLISSYEFEEEYEKSSIDLESECNWRMWKIKQDIDLSTVELDNLSYELG